MKEVAFVNNKLPFVEASYQFTVSFGLTVTDKEVFELLQAIGFPLLTGAFGNGLTITLKISDKVEQKLLFILAKS